MDPLQAFTSPSDEILTKEDFRRDENPLNVEEDTLQLYADIINVVEGRVSISTFPPDYQKKIENAYRFSALRYPTKYTVIAKRTGDTLDAV